MATLTANSETPVGRRFKELIDRHSETFKDRGRVGRDAYFDVMMQAEKLGGLEHAMPYAKETRQTLLMFGAKAALYGSLAVDTLAQDLAVNAVIKAMGVDCPSGHLQKLAEELGIDKSILKRASDVFNYVPDLVTLKRKGTL